jgi:alcohol sulfotransferase
MMLAAERPAGVGFPWAAPPPLRQAGALGLMRRVAKEAVLAAALARADGFIASYPKSGRTWLRFILANYLNRVLELGLTIDLRTMFWLIPNDVLDRERGSPAYRFRHARRVPFLVMSHGLWRRSLFQRKPVVLLVREPKDTLVSLYFHLTRHSRAFAGDLKAFIADPQHGAPAFSHYCNRWADGLRHHPHLVLAYEQLRRAPEEAVADLLRFFALPVEPAALAAAVAASSLDAMGAVERQGGIPGHRYDPGERDSRRVRRGEIGGFRAHLDEADVACVERICASRLSEPAKRLLAGAGLVHG